MTTYDERLSSYITELFARNDAALQKAWENTPKKGLPAISIKPEEGRFLQVLARACNATKALEIGTLGGYSGIWIARGLAPGGKLISLESEPKHASVAREHFTAAGLSDLIEIRVGNAHELLPSLESQGPFDFIFIDAEKPGYAAYFDWAFSNTHPGSVIAAHNAFRGGAVVKTGIADDATKAIQEFNEYVANHPGVLSTIYPAGDGTLIAVKIA